MAFTNVRCRLEIVRQARQEDAEFVAVRGVGGELMTRSALDHGGPIRSAAPGVSSPPHIFVTIHLNFIL